MSVIIIYVCFIKCFNIIKPVTLTMLLSTHADERTLTSLPVIIFIGLFSILGVTGNGVVIFVYKRKYPTCNFKYFVLVLAGLDLTSCMILMPMEIYTLLHWFMFESAVLCKIKSFLNVFTVSSSASTLLLIAIDRFRKVCKPHSKQIQPKCAIKLTVLVLFLSAIPASSDAVFWGIHTYQTTHEGINITVRMCEKDDAFKDTIWPQLHVAILYAGVNCVVMLSTIVLYVLIAIKLFCIPAGPLVRTTEITVVTPRSDDSGVEITGNDNENEALGNVFRFPADIESGLSDSEDFDIRSSVNLSDSHGDVTDDNLNELTEDDASANATVEQLEMVPLRNNREEPEESSAARKKLTVSIEVLSEPGERNSLQVPGLVLRRVPKSPVSPTTQKMRQTTMYHRRRSTIASLAGRTGTRLRRKTLIMFILTAVFVGTTMLYFCLIVLMADANNFLTELTASQQTAWIFFLRLYFINSVINPILYGFLDPRFRRALWKMGSHITFATGSLKRNIGLSIRSRSSTGNTRNEVSVVQLHPLLRPILKSRSSITMSE